MTVTGDGLEDLWRAATAGAAVSAFRTVPVGVEILEGPLLAGVDRSDRRHLLVPISARHTLRQDLDGRAVVLRRRVLEDEQSYRVYAALELVDTGMSDLFTSLCVEVVTRIEADPARAIAALRRVLDDWRALLAGTREVLGPEALAGLFAELHVLHRMIEHDAGAVAFWTGPTGAHQDFHRGDDALEVKATTRTEGRTIQIHGIDQLDLAPPGRLTLHWIRLRTDDGTSVPDMIDVIAARTDDAQRFRKLLRDNGYQDSDRAIYARRRFTPVEERSYLVGQGFPRIVRAGLCGDAVLAGIDRVRYEVDLDSAAADAHRLAQDPVAAFLGAG